MKSLDSQARGNLNFSSIRAVLWILILNVGFEQKKMEKMRFEQKSMFHKILTGKKTFGCHQRAEKLLV